MNIWGISNDAVSRADEIIPQLENPKKILDICCGEGLTLSKIKKAFPDCYCLGIDITDFPQWKDSEAEFRTIDLVDFIKTNEEFDYVLMLNSFRNWEGETKDALVKWLTENIRYFITSTNLPYVKKVIGSDVKNIDLELYDLSKQSQDYRSDGTNR